MKNNRSHFGVVILTLSLLTLGCSLFTFDAIQDKVTPQQDVQPTETLQENTPVAPTEVARENDISATSTGENLMPMLEKTPWVLTSFKNEELNLMLQSYQLTLQFDPENGKIAGKGGCNNYFASYQLNGTKLTLGPVGSTMMMCPDPQMTLEGAFHQALDTVTGYKIEGANLILIDAAGETLLQFSVEP